MNKLVTILLFMVSASAISQELSFYNNTNFPLKKDSWIDVRFKKSGPYIGVQRGEFTVIEIGGEKQWKKVKLIRPVTHALHTGFNYNFKYNVLGYDFGYWFQVGRLDLTYGANLIMRTDFNETRLGAAPVVGFKLFQFHLQTGYNFMTPTTASEAMKTNSFFISLRWVLISKRDLTIERKGKKDKEKKGGLFKRS